MVVKINIATQILMNKVPALNLKTDLLCTIFADFVIQRKWHGYYFVLLFLKIMLYLNMH
jgi:hypothetical protein